MSEYVNPLDDPAHTLYEEHQRAWAAKRNGQPVRALRLWQTMLTQHDTAPTSVEFVEIRRQMAVCLRLLWRLQAADELFRDSYRKALPLDESLARAVLFDWSTVLLDRGKADEAVALLESVFTRLDMSHPQYRQVKAYLGRAYGWLSGKENRAKAQEYLFDAIKHLAGELCFDACAWLLEIRFWRGRLKYSLRTLRFARTVYPARTTDVVIRYVGGKWLHRQLRRTIGLMIRLR